jgi:hypothetical protein
MKVRAEVSLISLYSVQTNRNARTAPAKMRIRVSPISSRFLKYAEEGSVTHSLSQPRLANKTVHDMTGVSASKISRGLPRAAAKYIIVRKRMIKMGFSRWRINITS